MIRALCAVAVLAGVNPVAAAQADSHRAPVESLSGKPAAVADERRETLAEMWRRDILAADMNQWSPQDMALLLRMRKAEARGALRLLRRRFHSLKGFSVQIRTPGSGETRVRLTRRGFETYLLVKSQEALQYFESKDVAAKWAYGLTDLQGRALFDRASGMLTEAGDELYSRALLNLPAFWRTGAGEIMGNRPPSASPASLPRE